MRMRLPFAGAFLTLSLLAAYLGLTSHSLPPTDPSTPSDPSSPPSTSIPTSPVLPLNDKALHFLAFFLLTLSFYWILDTSRRRVLHLTILSITLGLGIGSEFLQAVIPNGRDFDVYDIAANVAGSLVGLGGCSWFHGRMLERKRLKGRRGYGLVAGGEDLGLDGEEDLELGDVGVGLGIGAGEQEEGVVSVDEPVLVGGKGKAKKSIEDEVDNWDENIEDAWDVDADEDEHDIGVKTPSASSAGEEGEGGKKRND